MAGTVERNNLLAIIVDTYKVTISPSHRAETDAACVYPPISAGDGDKTWPSSPAPIIR
jgi:hypothetical protein